MNHIKLGASGEICRFPSQKYLFVIPLETQDRFYSIPLYPFMKEVIKLKDFNVVICIEDSEINHCDTVYMIVIWFHILSSIFFLDLVKRKH